MQRSIYSFLIFIFLRMLQIRAKYSETYKAVAYSLIPSVIFLIIPLVGLFGVVYSIYLMVVGVAILNYIPKRKAVLPVLLPIIVLIIIGMAIIIYAINKLINS